ncbi:uncharacterized protein LOC131658358, partial [Vicia villosa]|uniref:uncharacterized protein LOC131658358 n=1 Tax=Vicia villosa TaxID=3911 RepID=UPI00273A971D
TTISVSRTHDMNILNKHTIANDVGKSHVVIINNIQNVSPRNSTAEKGRVSSVSVSECRVDLDLKSDDVNVKAHLVNVKRDCRICHLSMDMNNHDKHESESPIELGCSCKDDLAAAHKQCAETWFKIKGNKTCEICGSIASNVAGHHVVGVEMTEQWNEVNDASMLPPTEPTATSETRSFSRGQWFMNFILVCMVFAFIFCWLFHFNMPS